MTVCENGGKQKLARDELVLRIQPNEAIYLKINTKRPGEMGFSIEETELALITFLLQLVLLRCLVQRADTVFD